MDGPIFGEYYATNRAAEAHLLAGWEILKLSGHCETQDGTAHRRAETTQHQIR